MMSKWALLKRSIQIQKHQYSWHCRSEDQGIKDQELSSNIIQRWLTNFSLFNQDIWQQMQCSVSFVDKLRNTSFDGWNKVLAISLKYWKLHFLNQEVVRSDYALCSAAFPAFLSFFELSYFNYTGIQLGYFMIKSFLTCPEQCDHAH